MNFKVLNIQQQRKEGELDTDPHAPSLVTVLLGLDPGKLPSHRSSRTRLSFFLEYYQEPTVAMSGTVLLWWGKVIILVSVLCRMVSANCTDDQILKYFTSSKLPWDNYHRISKAVYPPSQSPSLLIKIRVKFFNESSASSSTDVCDKDTHDSEINYTWSMACLYVSGGKISLSTMNVFSLGTIWPNRREAELCIKLPQSCRRNLEKGEKMKYFLSKVGMITCICNFQRTFGDPLPQYVFHRLRP